MATPTSDDGTIWVPVRLDDSKIEEDAQNVKDKVSKAATGTADAANQSTSIEDQASSTYQNATQGYAQGGAVGGMMGAVGLGAGIGIVTTLMNATGATEALGKATENLKEGFAEMVGITTERAQKERELLDALDRRKEMIEEEDPRQQIYMASEDKRKAIIGKGLGTEEETKQLDIVEAETQKALKQFEKQDIAQAMQMLGIGMDQVDTSNKEMMDAVVKAVQSIRDKAKETARKLKDIEYQTSNARLE